eukprot:2306824-Pleurochrysis_carterae.AAC.5
MQAVVVKAPLRTWLGTIRSNYALRVKHGSISNSLSLVRRSRASCSEGDVPSFCVNSPGSLLNVS